jgi:hypothetical protein
MIPTHDGVLVDECDPLFPLFASLPRWVEVKRRAGMNLNRTLCETYLLITSEDDYPDYPRVRSRLKDVCRSLNANT